MRTRLLPALLAATFCTSLSAAPLVHIPLQWKPTSELQLGTMQMPQTPVQFTVFTDARDNKEGIGENDEDDKPKPVTTADDVGAFVGGHVRKLFEQAGLKTVDGNGAVTVSGEVTRFYVRETSTYKSEVAVHLTVRDAAGKTLWAGLASGDATRFGRSYKAENYYEVLSDAVVNTVSSMLQDAQFQKALSGQ